MSLKRRLITLRDNYVAGQVERLRLPEFPPEEAVRQRIRFSGRVQHVGFRLAVSTLALRLGLTGYCKNLAGGDVLAEFQGAKSRIEYLVAFLESLIRIRIRRKEITDLPVREDETDFLKL